MPPIFVFGWQIILKHFFPSVYGCFFWFRLQKIRYLFVGGFQVTDVNVAIVSPDFDLLKATSAQVFSQNSLVAFRWVVTNGSPHCSFNGGTWSRARCGCVLLQKKGQSWASWAFGGKVSSCGQVRGWFSKVKGLYFHFYTSPVHHIWDDFKEFKQEPLVCTNFPSQSGR